MKVIFKYLFHLLVIFGSLLEILLVGRSINNKKKLYYFNNVIIPFTKGS